MGWTVLYIAFGIVALWLLGEVLLQYKARLRWRMLAFVGFLGVVVGVILPSVVVIALGAIVFALGQTYVTLSFRRGFSTGWALGGQPGSSKRRRGRSERPEPAREPTLQVSDLEMAPVPPAPDLSDEHTRAMPAYAPEPMPDDTGQYGVYNDATPQPYPAPDTSGYGTGYDAAYGQDSYQGQYGYDDSQQQGQYAAYSDPYIGSQQQYEPYDPYSHQSYAPQQADAYVPGQYSPEQYGGQAAGGQGQYGAQPYLDDLGFPAQPPFSSDTPPGGVWVPQQRDGETPPPGSLPPEQPYPYQPYQPDHNNGYDEQYRY
ncbi:hypothetical protein [Streptomyces sp. H27-D2]|uniref:hypothetical protein n=1 Tax=Streptomyces sp. H27-D2 TaxID=3046304 RepID=UPI002DBC0F3A|nr:hypothetical protein [Streptomyces sp. H27-D2]MEC4018933.1 hypothetical protein [Streptomyces sp. H27-D2]